MKRKYETGVTSHESQKSVGSALILTVVLTSLLAIVGVLFLMVARVDRMATSAVSQSLELDLAVDTVVAKISGQLIWDVPGTILGGGARAEYHDYPGLEDQWLAVTEPYEAGGNYFWRRISDIYGRFGVAATDLPVAVVPDYQDRGIMAEGLLADADGDGIADSRWVIVPGITSSKGQPVFVAVRIIDNGGMLNINTAFTFDPCDARHTYIDGSGSSQIQINLMGLTDRGVWTRADEEALLLARAIGIDPYNLSQYESAVTWSYGQLPMPYTPFDISDELELRNRFLLNQIDTHTRIEQLGAPTDWTYVFRTNLKDPLSAASSGIDIDGWFARANFFDPLDPASYNFYDYRHIATTCSMDRVITPDGIKMVTVTGSPQKIFEALASGIDPNFLPGIDANDLAAQLAVNIRDFYDGDTTVTAFTDPRGITSYGVEPQPFISEIAFKISGTDPTNSANNHFAVELYNPFDVDIPLSSPLSSFTLELRRDGTVVNTVYLPRTTIAADSRLVIVNSSAASADFGITGLLKTKLVLAKYTQTAFPPEPPDYAPEKYDIYLIRTVGGRQIYLDRQDTEDAWFKWSDVKDTAKFYSRADNDWNIVYQVFDPNINTLDRENRPPGPGPRKNYNIPSFAIGLRTVGDIARVLTVGPSTDRNNTVGAQIAAEPNEWSIRIDLQNPAFANIFQYLTVIDPTAHGRPGEARIKGRININTAPPFVIAQLPWVGREVAQAIVAYRDKLQLLPGIVDYSGGRARGMWDLRVPAPPGMFVREEPGFANICELLNVTHALNVHLPAPLPAYAGPFDIRKYGHGRDKDPGGVDIDQAGFPDLTPGDGVANDFEERDLIFSRISNLATVRSDVFTAYILVRIGADGPQKRVIAILDRSEVKSTDKYPKVKIRALHPVPDPW